MRTVSRLDDSRRIHDRNKYGVKRARALFTEGYNCQKNKRSQSLFAHVSLRHHVAPSEAELLVPCLLLPPATPLASATSPIRYPRPLLSPLWLPSVHAAPTPSRRRQRPLSPPHRPLLLLPLLFFYALPRRLFLAFLSRSHRLPATIAAPWKSSLESRVNEFAITIFHVDVTTYSLVGFRALAPALHPHRVRSTACDYRLPLALSTHNPDAAPRHFLGKSITNANNARRSNVGIHLAGDTSIMRDRNGPMTFRGNHKRNKSNVICEPVCTGHLSPPSAESEYLKFVLST